MEINTLYKRSKTGTILSYRIYVDNAGKDPCIVKVTGRIDGKKIYHRDWIYEGKNIGKSNETTPLDQAILQIESDYRKKLDEGYKSASQLGWDTVCDLKEWLEKTLPKFNTTSDGVILPMLAKKLDWKKVTYPCLVEPKLDGCKMIISMTSSPVDIKFYSRKGKEFTTLDHIKNEILSTFNKNPMLNKGLDIVTDGEIYCHGMTFQNIVSALKKENEDTPKLKFRMYDVVNNDTQDSRYLSTINISDLLDCKSISHVEGVICNNQEEVEELHTKYVLEGYEGAMVRLLDGKYEQGHRSSNLLKLKVIDTCEREFHCFELGQRGVEDLKAMYLDTINDKLELYSVKMAGTILQKQEWLEKEAELVGEMLTIQHIGFTDDGVLRFPTGLTFRDYE